MSEDVVRPLLDDAPMGSMPKAIIAGSIAALVGAGVWAGIEMMTGYQIGWIAIGIGFLCGFAVRFAGKGTGVPFRIVGAVCALAGCFLGSLWAFDHAVSTSGLEWELSLMDEIRLLAETTAFMTWVIFAIAVWEGWKFSVDEDAGASAAAPAQTKPGQ